MVLAREGLVSLYYQSKKALFIGFNIGDTDLNVMLGIPSKYAA